MQCKVQEVGRDIGIPDTLKAFADAIRRNVFEDPGHTDGEESYARTSIVGSPGANNTNQIHLYYPFYAEESEDEQGGTLVHEETHGYFKMHDVQLEGLPNFDDSFGQYGYHRSFDSHDFTIWLMNGCPGG